MTETRNQKMENRNTPTNSTAIITGGAIRVGKAIALELAQAGYHIALHYHNSQEEAEQTAEAIAAAGGTVDLFNADLAESSVSQQLIDEVTQTCGAPSVLVNNAAIFERATLMETDADLFDRHLATNFKAPFFLSQAFVKIAAPDANIINILDTYITKTTGAYFAYLLSKKALAAFTQMAARELAPKIRVNGVALGITLPSGDGLEAGYMVQEAATLPLQTTATLQDITLTIRQILDNPAITGQTLFVDGGKHLL